MTNYLDFEKPLAEIEGKAEELRALARANEGMDVSNEAAALDAKAASLLDDLYKDLSPWRKCQVARHPERPHCKDYIKALFTEYTPLAGDRAFAEDRAVVGGMEDPGELGEEFTRLADVYHCNFSLFQSLPDVWAIDQLHPIVPLQRLDEAPDRRAILADITCDSDGKVDRFILGEGTSPSLPVHSLTEDTYYFGVFFVGAYQETLGDLHNLFGDTTCVTIELLPEGGFDLMHEQEGDTIAQVLSYVEFDPEDCITGFRRMVDAAIARGEVTAHDRRKLMSAYRDSLTGYTYFERHTS